MSLRGATQLLRSNLEGLLVSGLNTLAGLPRHFVPSRQTKYFTSLVWWGCQALVHNDKRASLRVTAEPLRGNPEVLLVSGLIYFLDCRVASLLAMTA